MCLYTSTLLKAPYEYSLLWVNEMAIFYIHQKMAVFTFIDFESF